MHTHFQELEEQGYTILKALLTPHQVAEAIAALKELYAAQTEVSAHEPNTLRTFNITARAEIFRQIIQLPRLVVLIR